MTKLFSNAYIRPGTQFSAVSQTGFATRDPNEAQLSYTAPSSARKDSKAVEVNKSPAQHIV